LKAWHFLQNLLGYDERVRQVRVATAIGSLVGLGFALFNILTDGMLVLGLIELAAVLLLIFPAIALSRFPRWVHFSESLLLLAAIVIFGALIVHGGIEGTGILWVFTTPFLAFFLKGQRLGWWCSAAFLALTSVYLLWLAPFITFGYPYSPTVATHFVLSLLFYTLVAAAFNYVRIRYEAQLLQAKDHAEKASDEARLAQQRSDAAYAAKSRFLAAASHDLRQPAHALGLFVDRLSQVRHTAPAPELLNGVQASARALQEMLDSFFDYSRLEATADQVRAVAVSIDAQFEHLRLCFANSAAEKGLTLRFRTLANTWVQTDPVLLQRVLLNLVSNAIRYTHQGSVLVTCRRSADAQHMRIQVWDSGIGMDAQYHEQIFEEFFQIGNQARDRSKGLGLGLSMVERSCQLLRHPLELRSAAGCGTRFTLTVPQAPTMPFAEQAPAVEAVEPGALHGLNILLIEDDPLGGKAMCALMKDWGCTVYLVRTANQAFDLLAQGGQIDLVVSDYRLEGELSGVETIDRLRKLMGHAVPACLISGDTDTELNTLAANARLLFLKKPVQPAKLRSYLRRVLTASAVMPDAGTAPR